jgi:uncharacterized membrane protein YvbJ
VTPSVDFCNRCGTTIEEDERTCRCCGAETIDANTVMVLKRISARRSRRGREEDGADDNPFPL